MQAVCMYFAFVYNFIKGNHELDLYLIYASVSEYRKYELQVCAHISCMHYLVIFTDTINQRVCQQGVSVLQTISLVIK